jgi:hypothetical protein
MTVEQPLVETCECGHSRREHADRDNRLQVVRLSMTEADDEGEERQPAVIVHGAGACTVAGCGCQQFTDAPE